MTIFVTPANIKGQLNYSKNEFLNKIKHIVIHIEVETTNSKNPEKNTKLSHKVPPDPARC